MSELDDDFSSEADDFEIIDTDNLKNEKMQLDQGHGMYIGDRIRLASAEMQQLKNIIDKEINPTLSPARIGYFDVDMTIPDLKIPSSHNKLKRIPVSIEEVVGRTLVKVGPCDLSGVGGHHVREHIIRNVVNQALKNANSEKGYDTVNVSACIGVRGRMQMVTGAFVDNRQGDGAHMNAYVKTEKESTLTHWEPRKGPQSFFNDTICAMVSSVCTSLFEKGIRDNNIHSASEATESILKSASLKETFDHVVSMTKGRIIHLVDKVKEIAGIQKQQQGIKAVVDALKPDDSEPHTTGSTPDGP
ncbi:MAG: hypothetical protein JJT82_10795 [Legionellaceae bacterium]|nr:hypothetical protein [Legionellaceae bacterium]